MFTTVASPKNTASGGRLSARSSIDSWIAATCATDSRVAALENPDCRNEMLLAFSCHGRYFCPSCHAKRVAAFADWLAAELLDGTPSPPLRLHHPKTAAATLSLQSLSSRRPIGRRFGSSGFMSSLIASHTTLKFGFAPQDA